MTRKTAAPAHHSRGLPVPNHVAILGLGPSLGAFVDLTKRLGGKSAWCDETWGINAVGDVIACDRIFHMDDLKVQEARAAARPEGNIAAMVKWLRRHPGPIYTSRLRPGYPGLMEFPLQEVLRDGGLPYFNSTAAYAIAYAVLIGVKKISLFGLDYTLPNVHAGEKGRACCEFWLGIAAARGIVIVGPEQTTLMDYCAPERERFYGFDCVDVAVTDDYQGRAVVSFSDRAAPTAEEIEARYDHRRHPNRLIGG